MFSSAVHRLLFFLSLFFFILVLCCVPLLVFHLIQNNTERTLVCDLFLQIPYEGVSGLHESVPSAFASRILIAEACSMILRP
uniref:Putative secreted protein n=1 Tax=Amblyomma cajennense TaxID=34607 RepID=A0A023FDH1_AMBCJ